MIAPRRTRLLRVNNLQLFQQAIANLVSNVDPWCANKIAVLVSTRAAAEQLRCTFEDLLQDFTSGSPVLALPSLLTRDDWYMEMHQRFGSSIPLLLPVERQVCMFASAREAAITDPPPFKIRPGLVSSIVAFYDQLRRCPQSVDSFERLLVSELEPSTELDRGARHLLNQTRFLAATFRSYKRRINEAKKIDEHELRRLLTLNDASQLFSHIVVTIGDQAVERAGLWPVDFDLLTRLPGLEQIDVIATEAVLAAGFYERLTEMLPGIREERFDNFKHQKPFLLSPDLDGNLEKHFTYRDREDELLAVIRFLKCGGVKTKDVSSEAIGFCDGREAVVFQRPLPYLYLANQLFDQARVPFEAHNALPLAAEPYAAAVDLVADCVTSEYSRSSVINLLRSPHFNFKHGEQPLNPLSIERFDKLLRSSSYKGGLTELARLAAKCKKVNSKKNSLLIEAAPAALLMVSLAKELEKLQETAPATELLKSFLSFLTHHKFVSDGQVVGESTRETEARIAITAGLAGLAEAYQQFDNRQIAFSEAVLSFRRWIESQAFIPFPGTTIGQGVQLIDSDTAPYGRFRSLFIVGLVDNDWPPPPDRNVLYPSSILVQLGWPREKDRIRAARARFSDLKLLPLERLSLSTFSLEEDTVVMPSSFLEASIKEEQSTIRAYIDFKVNVTPDDALAFSSVPTRMLSALSAQWLCLRQTRPDSSLLPFHGFVGPHLPSSYAVTALERYLECPFKYFAKTLLKLDDELSDQQTLTSQQRGLLLHQVLEGFYSSWEATIGGAITLDNLDKALENFHNIAKRTISELYHADRAVLQSWLLGSAAAPGLAERLFLLEVSRPDQIIERFVELRIDGKFVFAAGERYRNVRIRGVIDRIDLFSDGTFSLFDYKSNKAPQRGMALQLPVYVRCVEQQLDGYRGKSWRVEDAAYLAIGDERLHVPLSSRKLQSELAKGDTRVVEALEAIDSGIYPPRPAESRLCSFCQYPTVCRKDYVGEG